MKIRFENTDTAFTNGKQSHTIDNHTGPTPRTGEEIRLLDVDAGGPVREVLCVTHYIKNDQPDEIAVFLFVSER